MFACVCGWLMSVFAALFLPRQFAVLLLCLCLSPLASAAEYGFRIVRAELKPDMQGQAYRLNADIDYRFTEPVIDALRNGVALTLALNLRVQRPSVWGFDVTVLEARSAFRIRYHALAKLFQIVDENGDRPRNFASVNALLEAMGSLRGLSVPDDQRLLPGQRYHAHLSVALDIESLPLPLRPVAYLAPAWHLGSPVYEWSFVN